MVRLFVARAKTVQTKFNNRSSSTDEDNCGQICSLDFSSKQDGRYYPLLRKHVDCPVIVRRMARRPVVYRTPPPRFPPPNSISSFTQHGQCPVKSVWYIDQSNSTSSSRPLYFNASTFQQLIKEDLSGKVIVSYGDPYRRLKPTLERYRQHIHNGHVAVVGTEKPWAEAMMLNLGAARITTLEYRALVIEHNSLVTITPSQFARNVLEATNNGKNVCSVLTVTSLVLHASSCRSSKTKITIHLRKIQQTQISFFINQEVQGDICIIWQILLMWRLW